MLRICNWFVIYICNYELSKDAWITDLYDTETTQNAEHGLMLCILCCEHQGHTLSCILDSSGEMGIRVKTGWDEILFCTVTMLLNNQMLS